MTIILKSINKEGIQEQREFADDIDKIVISFATSIDLSPLSSCSNLKELLLTICEFKDIDLSPLSQCTTLETLQIFGGLKIIDLTPLRNCTNLKNLILKSNKFQSIDLSPLSQCMNLQKLILSFNPLQYVNLTPLSSLSALQTLELNNMELESIDLSPLSSCSNLKGIELGFQPLPNINLTPLATCSSLEQIGLSNIDALDIDLKPLSSCKNLTHILLMEHVPLRRTIDVTPLLNNPELNEKNLPRIYIEKHTQGHSWLRDMERSQPDHICYWRPTSQYHWDFLYEVIQNFPNDYRIQHDVLVALGLVHYGFIDCDLTDQFLAIPPETNTEDAREMIRKKFVDEIVTSVDNGGQTTGLNLDELIGAHSEIAARAQEIVELRNAEMQKLVVHKTSLGNVKIDQIHLTAYGYDVLSAIGFRRTISESRFGVVKKTFADLGFEIKTTSEKSISSSVSISEELKESILWIAENKGKPWRVISDTNF